MGGSPSLGTPIPLENVPLDSGEEGVPPVNVPPLPLGLLLP